MNIILVSLIITPCLSALTESTSWSSPIKIWPVESRPCEKRLIFHLPDVFISTRGKCWIMDILWWVSEFYLDEFGHYASDISHSWCLLRSWHDPNNLWWHFSQNIILNFLVMIVWFSFIFTDSLMMSWELDFFY